MWHHHSPDEPQDKWGEKGCGQETQRDYKKSEIQSVWGHMAQPLIFLPSLPWQDTRESAGGIRCCWAIWLLKPQQRQWEMSLRVLGSPAAPGAARRRGPGPTALPGAQRLHVRHSEVRR